MNTHPHMSIAPKNSVIQRPSYVQYFLSGLFLALSISPVTAGVIFSSDRCETAVTISGEGTFEFDNTIATLDGPPHARCAQIGFGEDQIDRDVWAIWTANCTATIFVQTCGLTTVDTRIAVYSGGVCPTGDDNLLECNDDRCDLQSLVSFDAVSGQNYLIRVGSYPGEVGGTGSVSISCGIDACPGKGDCMTANGSIGCNDISCCETVCSLDRYCCEIEWDENCALEAGGLCTGSFDSCVEGAGDCTIPKTPICRGGIRDTLPCVNDLDCPDGGCSPQPPGCGDVDCCNAVCHDDPFCCIDSWDEFCVAAEPRTCFLSCGTGSGDCFVARPEGSEESGCDDVACCEQVCPRDSYCCQVEWDATCVQKAQIYCEGSPVICPLGKIVWIDPPNGVVDARYDVDPTSENPLGIETIEVQGPIGIHQDCWSLCETDGTGLFLESQTVGTVSGIYQLRLNRPATSGAVTTLTYTDDLGNETTAEFTSHPANSNADGFSNTTDISSIIAALQGLSIPPFGAYSVDMDHSSELHPSDILAAVDLLNGANPFSVWMNTSKPTSENICP